MSRRADHDREMKRIEDAIEALRETYRRVWVVGRLMCGVRRREDDFHFFLEHLDGVSRPTFESCTAEEIEFVIKHRRAFEQWMKGDLDALPPSTKRMG